MKNKITSFRGKYCFLSNFYPTPVSYSGVIYPSAENAFQAAKCANPKDRRQFKFYSPSEAKRNGRRVRLRPNWNAMRLPIMKMIVKDKFAHNPELADKLRATGDAELIEENDWNDRFWGVCNGIGENHLGKILMKIRDEIK